MTINIQWHKLAAILSFCLLPLIGSIKCINIHQSIFSLKYMRRKEVIIAALLLISTALLLNLQKQPSKSQFEEWKEQHGVIYSSEYEKIYREKVFMHNLAAINLHNSDPHKTYEMGLNQFSALTTEEFATKFLGTIVPTEKDTIVEDADKLSLRDVDWEKQGAVTRVKSQGNCGACWAFSTIGGIEGLYAIINGKIVAFSEQQLIDCAGSKYGNKGCNGGLMDSGYKYVIDHGVLPEEEYPYKGSQQKCLNDTGKFKISGFANVKTCSDLANALTERPISVVVDATNWSPYKSGVFNNCKTSLNHGVLLTGMTDQYWRIKNSWGSAWGESGYIRLARGNTCGVCNVASYPIK